MSVIKLVFVILILLMVTYSIFCSPSNPRCGKQNHQPYVGRHKRFINAKEAKRHSWPWIVNVLVDEKHNCGGTLLPSFSDKETDIVLTAAHCILHKSCVYPDCRVLSSKVIIKAGNHNRFLTEVEEKDIDVSNTVIHPGYPADINSDIAIIKLKEPVKYSNSIQAICLPSADQKPAEHETCFVAGWGEVTEEGGSVSVLHQSSVPVPNDTLCKMDEIWGLHANSLNYRKQICAGYLNGTGNICNGDSGSPLMCTFNGLWTQYGLAVRKHYLGCGTANKPAIFERVSYFSDWIREQIKLLSSL